MRRILIILILCISYIAKSYAADVVFRFDDFLLAEDSLQKDMLRVFEKYEIPLVIGIIPFNPDGTICFDDQSYSDNLSYLLALQRKGLLEIALHGFSHSQRTPSGEMGGLPYQEQMSLISKGRMALDSLFATNVITFIPPWNNYDSNTLSILDSLDFKIISSCLSIEQEFSNRNIQYFPTSVGTKDAFDSFRQALGKNGKRQGLIVFMFHWYDFNDFTIQELDDLLAEVSCLDYVHCRTFSQLVGEGIKSGKKRMEANIEVNLLSKLLGTATIILPTWIALAIRISNLLLYLIVTLVWCLIIRLVLKNDYIPLLYTYVLLAIFVVICIWFHRWTPLKTVIPLFLVPVISGFVEYYLRKYRNKISK